MPAEPVVIPFPRESKDPIGPLPTPDCPQTEGFQDWEEAVLLATGQAVEEPAEAPPSASGTFFNAVVLAALILGAVLWHFQGAKERPDPAAKWFTPQPLQADVPDGESP